MRKRSTAKRIKKAARRSRLKEAAWRFMVDVLSLSFLLIVPAALFLHWLFFGYPL